MKVILLALLLVGCSKVTLLDRVMTHEKELCPKGIHQAIYINEWHSDGDRVDLNCIDGNSFSIRNKSYSHGVRW